jgi:hypothetical protein
MFMVQIEERNTQTNQRKRYYLKDASDYRRPAVMSLNVARHAAANVSSDWLTRRHATLIEAHNA